MKENARAFSKNSTTQENTWISRLKRRLRNLYSKENFKPDLSNTFDKPPYSYLFNLSQGFWLGGLGFEFICDLIFLRKFGYRHKFIHMIQVASINIQFKIKINGLLSEYFTLIQGFHQGRPFSMLLCIIAAEVLTILIDADSRIKGIQIGDHEINIINFGDDTNTF